MIKKLIDNLPQDKQKHIIVGVIYSILIVIGGLFGVYGATIGFFIGTFLNLYKEVWHDLKQKKGNAEVLDFIANEAPILITYLAYIL
jgi:hypothetical protein|tara:strand:- start:1367 stop:1627 length:261 start_codon:yes stop_codon:yes gene_type:complete